MLKKLAFQNVKELAEDLTSGHGRGGVVCPFCDGGVNKEKTFSILRTVDGVRYLCHRASCGVKGFLYMSLSEENFNQDNLPPPKPYDKTKYMAFQPLNKDMYTHLVEKYHLTALEIQRAGIKWSPTINRIVIPISTHQGLRAGFTGRSEDPKVKPKAIVYVSSPDLPLGAYYWCIEGKKDTLWLVEDQLSALRLSKYHAALALLGTNISDSLLADIKALGITNLVVCLDSDAAPTSMKLAARIGGLFDSVTVRFPPKDLKNMTPEELHKFVS